MKDADSPYRMKSERTLPNFGGAKNPFHSDEVATDLADWSEPADTALTTRPATEASPVLVTGSLFAEPVVEEKSPLHPAPLVASAQPELPKAAPTVKREKKVLLPAQKATYSLSGEKISRPSVLSRLNPLRWFGQSARRPERKPVQTELSLDRVRVVRNELNDADLEVISAGRKPTVKLVKPAGTTNGTLNRLTARVFGTGSTMIQ